MKLGVDWYPEQHPPERWADDVRRMREAGLELVRVGEFAWTLMEPARGRYDWGWLDRVIGEAAAAGVGVVLGTPTAVPPIWLCLDHPEILSVGPGGHRRTYGSRRFNCPTAPAYREASNQIAAMMAERYGGHEAVVGWQLDNEPANHESARCWCDLCEAAFRDWLRARYGTVDELNRAWGTVFWSGQYPAFETVLLPRETNAQHSPSLLLAHLRFAAGQALACIAEQYAEVAPRAHGRPVFSNLPADELRIDGRAVARLGGLAAVNLYPHGHGTPENQAYLLDFHHGHTGTAWVMEHQPGPINWTPNTAPVPPGQVRLWGWRAALHGYDVFSFFSWRPSRSGSEQYHTGLLRHDGSDDRGLGEATRLATELRAVDPEILRRPPGQVAVLASTEDAWTINLHPHRPELTQRELVAAAHAGARRLGHDVDVVAPEDDLTRFRVVLAPALHVATPARLAALRAALEAGAIVILGARSLVVDADDCWSEEPHPTGLTARLGSRVTDWFGHLDMSTLAVGGRPGIPVGPWTDVLEEPAPGSAAEVVARYETGWMAGLPAAVRNGGLGYLGATSTEAWTAILDALVGPGQAGRAGPGEERFARGGRVIVLHHDTLEIDGLG